MNTLYITLLFEVTFVQCALYVLNNTNNLQICLQTLLGSRTWNVVFDSKEINHIPMVNIETDIQIFDFGNDYGNKPSIVYRQFLTFVNNSTDIFEKLKTLTDWTPRLTSKSTFLIVILNNTNITQFFKYLWNMEIYKIKIVLYNGTVYNANPFAQYSNCAQNVIEELSSCKNTADMFSEKLIRFNNCPLLVGVLSIMYDMPFVNAVNNSTNPGIYLNIMMLIGEALRLNVTYRNVDLALQAKFQISGKLI